jgi:3-hydroxybutyrate dehydrogenase
LTQVQISAERGGIGWPERTALVTGAASGIGLAVAARLAELGAHVILVDLPGERLERAARGLSGAVAVEADLADEASIQRLYDSVATADILVNNAGLGALVPIGELTDERWDHLLTVMLKAPFMLTRAALPHMIERGYGRIVNVSSVFGHVGGARRAAYVSAKHGVLGLTKATAAEASAACYQVTVNAVCPAWVRTSALEDTLTQQAADRGLPKEDIIAEFLQRNLVKRLIEPADVAEAILFLCRPDMWSITGQSLCLDAGLLAT